MYTNGGDFPMLAQVVDITYTTLLVVYEEDTPLYEMTDFLHHFWMKWCLTLPEYGASVGTYLKEFCTKLFHSQIKH